MSSATVAVVGEELVLKLGVGMGRTDEEKHHEEEDNQEIMRAEEADEDDTTRSPAHPPVELSLRPLPGSSAETSEWNLEVSTRGFDVNKVPSSEAVDGEAAAALSVRSTRASDEEEKGRTRKKLRLSKEQSAFLEESFKKHNTLNPKQKLALAKQLRLRPRQIEVWFQNRRARTKLKQTEVDCEYLKRCCDALTQENRRLRREVAELRAFRTVQPFSAHLPATATMSLCPSCERVTSNHVVSSANTVSVTAVSSYNGVSSSHPAYFNKPRFYPFCVQPVLRRQPSATS